MGPQVTFRAELDRRNSDPAGRTWVYVPYDQLTDQVGPLSQRDPTELGIVLVESAAKARARPYHKQKLALVLANQRQFALEQAARGVAVDHRFVRGDFASGLTQAVRAHGPLTVMEPAEREHRQAIHPLVEAGALEVVPHEGWLSTQADFDALGDAPWRMDAFYRGLRQRTGWLMEDGSPEGGRYSFDGENREPWPGTPPAPEPPRFTPDAVTLEACEQVERHYADHPGRLSPEALPATRDDAEAHWDWALAHCLTHFGTYEDAMSDRSRGLFHTRVSPLVNLHRLLPRRVVADVAHSDAPLNAREGFVRQVLGWREFVRHVHRRTDGMREAHGVRLTDPLTRDNPLPAAFWEGAPSGLHCLDDAVTAVWEDGYTHHIVRLMVLANLATLLDVRPSELSDWFWVAYTDAYDWVVEPNVLGMGTFGIGDRMTTKPYVSGSNYLNKMSDHCGSCAFHPKKTCPITPLYWAFLQRHREALGEVDRMALPLGSLRRRSDARKQADARTYERVRSRLDAGSRLTPADLED